MSEHAWSQEQIAAYLANGLDAAEAKRLEVHARECSECATALERSRRLDSKLDSLFAAGRPGLELEDRALFALRMGRDRTPAREGWQKRLLIAAGITVFVTSVGFVGSRAEKFTTPWNVRGWSFAKSFTQNMEALGSDETDVKKMRSIEGVDRNLKVTNEDARGDLQPVEIKRLHGTSGEGQLELRDIAAIKEPQKQNLNQISQYGFMGLGPQLDGGPLGEVKTDGKESDGINLPGLVRWNDAGISKGYEGLNNLGVGMMFDSSVRRDMTNRRGDQSGDSYNRASLYNNYYSQSSLGVPGQSALQRPTITGNETTAERVVAQNTVTANEGMTEGPTSGKKPLDNFSMGLFGATGVGTSESTPPMPPTSRPSESLPVPKPVVVTPTQPAPAPNPDTVAQNVVIRSGEIEFEIESFDSAAATVTKLVMGVKGAFIATVNSEKLANGKVKGAITVRIPPEHLDGLLLDLRKELSKGGELKGSRIGSQDITKQYTDLESRLKAARTMEQRLLQIIKEGKGEIKQLLDAEKELGIWRTKIEEYEGERRYYANLIALSTLTITLIEKEIRAAASMTESERIQAGVEVEDVDKTYQQILAAVVDAKGRVTKSEVKQLSAGQFNATLNFEVAPEAAGPLRDRLRQLGRVTRLEIDRVQQPEGTVTKNAKVQRGDTQFFVQLYNLANIAPREVAVVQIAVLDVPSAYQALRDAVAKAAGRVLTAQLSEQDQKNIAAQFDFEVRRSDEATLRTAVDSLGEVVTRQVTRAPESDNVTDAKVLYRTMLFAANQLKPRERTTLDLEVVDVDQTVLMFGVQVAEVKGRQADSQFTRDRSGRLTAKLVYVIPLMAAPGLVERFKAAGAVRVFQSSRDPQVPEGKYATTRMEVTLTNSERIVGADDGLWPQVRHGLTYSASALLTSVTWMVFGLCVVLPWALIGYGGYRVLRWLLRSKATVAVTPPSAA